MLLVEDERSGGDAVGGEGGGGARRGVGHDEGKVVAAALLESGFGRAKAEAARENELVGVGQFSEGFQSNFILHGSGNRE